MPIVSGASGGSTQAGVGFTKDAADAGADAFMALPSYIVKDTMCISFGFSSKDEIRLINVSIPTREFSIEKASKVSPTSLVIKLRLSEILLSNPFQQIGIDATIQQIVHDAIGSEDQDKIAELEPEQVFGQPVVRRI